MPGTPKAKRRIVAGDLIAVPIASGEYVLCRVLFASRRYRKVILLGCSDVLLTSPNLPAQLPARFDALRIYTASQCISSGRWHWLGSTPATADDDQASLRTIAGSVWLRDEELRQADSQDELELPKMSVAGCGLVELELSEQIGGVR
jgi:hypothetical protein